MNPDEVTSTEEAETAPLEDAAEPGPHPGADQEIGNYRILREIGRGGMGTVFLAERRDDEYRQLVAVKLLRGAVRDSDLARRFRTERQILADLDHPNIAKILDGGTTSEGELFYVMEYVEGGQLPHHCEKNALSLRSRLLLFTDVLSAVQAAHQSLIVHRDLKPANILMTADGVPKLLDFGIAKVLRPEAFPSTVGETFGSSPMTLRYASPEQLAGEAISTATDVYSLGVLLFELLTGKLPYPSKLTNTKDLVRAICFEAPIRPSRVATNLKLSRDIDAVVLKALEKSPAERYPSAAAMALDLERFLGGHPVGARKAGAGYRMRKFVTRHPLAVTATVLALLALLAFTTALAVQNRRISHERDRALREVAKSRAVKVENLNQVGRLFLDAGSLDDASLAFERALEITGSDESANRRARFESLAGLAATAQARDEPAEASELYRRAFAVLGKGFRPQDMTVARTRSAYGEALMEAGSFAEAETMLRGAFEILVGGDDREAADLASARLEVLERMRLDAAVEATPP